MDSIGAISYYLNECYLLIKHVVDDNIICISATQLMHALAHHAHGACNTIQQLLRKALLHFS